MERLKKGTHPILSDSAISALNSCKIFTARDFIVVDSQKLSKISLLLFKEILEIKKHLLRKYAANSKNGYDCYKDLLKNSALISSGIRSIDGFLEGGLLTSNIYELCGKAACGKSLLAYTFIRSLAMEMEQNCFILDAKNDFSAEKFVLLCQEYSHEAVMNGLSKIFVKSIGNLFDLLNSLHEISQGLDENRFKIRLIVIDSLPALISNNTDYTLNNSCLTHLAKILHFIATKFHVVILILNLMTTWVEGNFRKQIKTKQTVSCGRFWYKIPNTRIKLEKEQNNLKLSVEKSNILSLNTISVTFDDIIKKHSK